MINLPMTISQLDAYSADLLRAAAQHRQIPAARTARSRRRAGSDQPPERRSRLIVDRRDRSPVAAAGSAPL